jgi:hypothetical protein
VWGCGRRRQDFHRLCTRKGLFNAHEQRGAKYVAAVLKLLYDEDVLGEPAILTWSVEVRQPPRRPPLVCEPSWK